MTQTKFQLQKLYNSTTLPNSKRNTLHIDHFSLLNGDKKTLPDHIVICKNDGIQTFSSMTKARGDPNAKVATHIIILKERNKQRPEFGYKRH